MSEEDKEKTAQETLARIRGKIKDAKKAATAKNPPAVQGDKHKHHAFTKKSSQDDNYEPKHGKE